MYIQVHRRVNIENRENTLKHIYIVKKATLWSLTVRYEIFTKTSNGLNIQIHVKNLDNFRFND